MTPTNPPPEGKRTIIVIFRRAQNAWQIQCLSTKGAGRWCACENQHCTLHPTSHETRASRGSKRPRDFSGVTVLCLVQRTTWMQGPRRVSCFRYFHANATLASQNAAPRLHYYYYSQRRLHTQQGQARLPQQQGCRAQEICWSVIGLICSMSLEILALFLEPIPFRFAVFHPVFLMRDVPPPRPLWPPPLDPRLSLPTLPSSLGGVFHHHRFHHHGLPGTLDERCPAWMRTNS